MFKSVDPQPSFSKLEEEVLEFWQTEKIFEKSLEQTKDGPQYIIYDGPPTANARPPLHTMVPMSFKDLVGRYQTMKGHYVPRQVGWDTHGLPVEVQMEKLMGLSGKKEILNIVPGDESASIKAFNEACRQSVWEYKQDWDKFVPRVGYWVDTANPYVTYDSSYVEGVWRVFKQIWDKDLVYKGYKVVPYCPRCGTALSSHEVAQEYQDTKDTSVYVAFPLVDTPQRAILAWTTTPWTLPGNVALAVGEDIDYVVVRQEESEYILAKSRLEVLRGEYTIVQEMKGIDLVGLAYQPLYPAVLSASDKKKHCIVPANFVTTEDGTGIVHTAVMYGEDDFNLGKELDLPMVHTVGPDGSFLDNVTEFKGMYVRDALVPILKDLEEKGRLYAKQTITHSYPFCWRCKTALIYYAKDSWFVAMSKLRSQLVANNANIEWFPDYFKTGRFGDFIKEARDWSISRERFWGVPLPVWISASGQMLAVSSFAELRDLAQNPELVGDEFDPHRPFVDEIVLVKDGEEYHRDPSVLDVWFDSGSMPYASGREAAGQFPADYIAEAIDQTRGWFYVLLALGTIIKDQSPFKRVVCMGHIVDENGKKMSKSLGNVLDPWETFAAHGVDTIRWYLYTVNSPGENKAFSHKELQTATRKSLLLLWNIFNYFVTYSNVAEFSPLTDSERAALRQSPELSLLDRWVLSRQASVSQQVTAHLDAYDFMRAGRLLESYINELSTWYLRRSRKRSDAQFFGVLYDLLLNLVSLMAPFTPFVTEKIYQVLRHPESPQSVHLTAWVGKVGEEDKSLNAHMQLARDIVEMGHSIRAAEKIKVRQPLARASLVSQTQLEAELLEIIAEELNVLEVQQVKSLEEGWPSQSSEPFALALDIQLTDELVQAGMARDFLRQIQQLRKNLGFQPGQEVLLVVDAGHRSLVEPLLTQNPNLVGDAYIVVDPEKSWHLPQSDQEVTVAGQAFAVDLLPLHVE